MTPLEVATSQIGYVESPPHSNQTKYGKWYGMDGQPWCMMFVQWCFDQAGKPLPYKTASCYSLLSYYRTKSPDKLVRTPEANDIVIYSFGHTGNVESSGSNYIYAIEGNTSPDNNGSQNDGGGVYRRRRSMETVQAFIHAYDFKEDDDYMTKDQILDELGDQWIATYDDLPSWAKQDVRWMLDNGIINGGTDYSVDPNDINMFLSDIKNLIATKRMIKDALK